MPLPIHSVDVVLPNLGFGMEEGRLIGWLKQAGDSVRKGEAIAEIEGDKATVELEATIDGILAEVLALPDTLYPVGTVLARIVPTQTPSLSQGAAALSVEKPPRASPLAQALARDHGVDLQQIKGTGTRGRIVRDDVRAHINAPAKTTKPLAAPAVRYLARNHNINLMSVRGSGPDGRIVRADIEALIAQPAPSPIPPPEGLRLSPMRQAVARQMLKSMQTAPHFYTAGELDFTDALNALPEGAGANSLLLYLTVKALQSVPALNATFENDRLYPSATVNLSVAVALDEGLITPVLHDAGAYSLAGLHSRVRDLVQRARAGKLRPEELNHGTFTVSNLGMIKQVDHFTAILNPPQVGILAVGAMKPRVIVRDGGLHIRTTAHLTLGADHRIIDGMTAARFIEAFDNHLHNLERTPL